MDSLDKIDLLILRTLQENANLTTKELASKVNLSTTPVFERTKRLQAEGYIKRYIAILDGEKLKCGFIVFCQVKLTQLNKAIAENFTTAVQSMPEVIECYNTSGEFDYLLKVCVPDMSKYREFIMNKLGTIDCLSSLQSIFVMDEIKHSYGFPISE